MDTTNSVPGTVNMPGNAAAHKCSKMWRVAVVLKAFADTAWTTLAKYALAVGWMLSCTIAAVWMSAAGLHAQGDLGEYMISNVIWAVFFGSVALGAVAALTQILIAIVVWIARWVWGPPIPKRVQRSVVGAPFSCREDAQSYILKRNGSKDFLRGARVEAKNLGDRLGYIVTIPKRESCDE